MDKNQVTHVSDIELLKRQIEREKKARQLAEQQLEAYSREIYLANESLKESLDHTKKKQSDI
ncbi:MAG: two-component system NtrC family sensor kinase, partial [Paraglaciecola sp.]